MIDPKNITNFDLTDEQLEEVLLFWICAAGKNAITVSKGLERVLNFLPANSPFQSIKNACSQENLGHILRKCGIGCFNNKAKTMWQLAHKGLNLRTCTPEDLESVYGIGMKTSRCFIIHSRKDANCAGLDRHILAYLNDVGYNVPITTPIKKKYLEIEQIFLGIAKRAGMSVAELDLQIWKLYSNNTI